MFTTTKTRTGVGFADPARQLTKVQPPPTDADWDCLRHDFYFLQTAWRDCRGMPLEIVGSEAVFLLD